MKPFELCIIWVQGIRSHGPPGKGGVEASELKKVDYRDCLSLKLKKKKVGREMQRQIIFRCIRDGVLCGERLGCWEKV